MINGNYSSGLDNYVARYMDENGCTLEQACKDLEISQDDVFPHQYYSEWE